MAWPTLSPHYIGGLLLCFLLNASLLVIFIGRIGRNLRQRDAAWRNCASARRRRSTSCAWACSPPAPRTSWARRWPRCRDPRRLGAHGAVRRRAGTARGDRGDAAPDRALQGHRQRHPDVRRRDPRRRAGQTTLHAFLDDLVDDWRERRAVAPARLPPRRRARRRSSRTPRCSRCRQRPGQRAGSRARRAAALEVALRGRHADLRVQDRGPGFQPQMLEQFGKPYQSSKGSPAAAWACSCRSTWPARWAARSRRTIPRGRRGGADHAAARRPDMPEGHPRPPMDPDAAAADRGGRRRLRAHAAALVRAARLPRAAGGRPGGGDGAAAAHDRPGYAVVDLKLAGGASGLACVQLLHEARPRRWSSSC
jgi:hypothetical protein